jgi:FtsP/CotA-like multicopper oxidase with cupredoxin domain
MGKAADAEAKEKTKGFEVGYDLFAINGRMLGHGEPIRVKQGERVLFHVLNASATEIRSLALPGHSFKIVALDGNPVPTQAEVPLLWLGTAERISALVEMKHPGVWVMGDLADDDRRRGMGIVVEYAEHNGKPQWIAPRPHRWDYSLFGHAGAGPGPALDETIEFTFLKHNAALEGFRNASDDIHPLHLHRHSFELIRIGGRSTSGVIKDVVMLGGYQEAEVDFLADNPGPTLFHCHQQLHMDFGFMALFNYV